MYAIPVTIDNGAVRLPSHVKLPKEAHSAMLVVETGMHANEDMDSLAFDLAAMRANPSLDFLASETDIYSADDVKPENRNPRFGIK